MPDTLPELPAFLYSRDLTARELREIEQYGAECRRQALEDAAQYLESVHPTRLGKFAEGVRAMKDKP